MRKQEILKEIEEEIEKLNKLQLFFFESCMKEANGELKPIYSDEITLFLTDLIGECDDEIDELIEDRLFLKLIEDNRIWIVSDLIEELEELENE